MIASSVEYKASHINNLLKPKCCRNETMIDKFNQICFFSKVLEGLGYSVPEAELTTFISQLDIDKSGR